MSSHLHTHRNIINPITPTSSHLHAACTSPVEIPCKPKTKVIKYPPTTNVAFPVNQRWEPNPPALLYYHYQIRPTSSTAVPPARRTPIIGADTAVPAFSGTLAGTNVAVGTIPEVNGESTTDDTPAKAGGCGVASGWMAAVVFWGLRTLWVACQYVLIYHTEMGGGKGWNALVNDVHDAIGGNDVGNQDPRRVDKQLAVEPAHREVLALARGELHWAPGGDEVGAEADAPRQDVVVEDAGEGLRGQGRDDGANGFKGVVVGRKDG